MLCRIARNTWPIRILFLAVYAILFSVQLCLKYNAFPVNSQYTNVEISVARYTASQPAAEQKLDKQLVQKNSNIKVSKRYLHKGIYTSPAIFSLVTTTFPVTTSPVLITEAACGQFYQLQHLLRGPPTPGGASSATC